MIFSQANIIDFFPAVLADDLQDDVVTRVLGHAALQPDVVPYDSADDLAGLGGRAAHEGPHPQHAHIDHEQCGDYDLGVEAGAIFVEDSGHYKLIFVVIVGIPDRDNELNHNPLPAIDDHELQAGLEDKAGHSDHGFPAVDPHVLQDTNNIGQQQQRPHAGDMVQIFTDDTQLDGPEDVLELDVLQEQQGPENLIDTKEDDPNVHQHQNTHHKLLLSQGQHALVHPTPHHEGVHYNRHLEVRGYDVDLEQAQRTIDVGDELEEGRVGRVQRQIQVEDDEEDEDFVRRVLGELEPEATTQNAALRFAHSLVINGGRILRDRLSNIIIVTAEMDALLREKITQLTSKCDVLQKNGKYAECIDIMEEIVSIKKNMYGIDHPEFDRASEKLCEYLNLAAMVELQKEKFDETIDHLRKAELVARNSLALKSTTYNNMACYYRRTGKVRTALSYLIQALDLELKIEQPKTLADTHINLCAVLSQLDRHEDALQHSMLSIILLQDEFVTTLLAKYKSEDGRGEQQINDERLAVLAIAYHNLGVEFEHLKRFDEALKIYKKALKFSKENLQNNEQLVHNLTRVVNSATEQMEDQKRHLLEQKSGKKLQRDLSEAKKDIYKDLSKTVERYRHLPKLRVNANQFNSRDHSTLQNYESANQSIDFGYRVSNNNMNNTKRTSMSKDKGYGMKVGNQTRFNKGFMDTPDSRGQLDSQLKVREGMGTRTNRQGMGTRTNRDGEQ